MIKKSQLQLVKHTDPVLLTPPKEFDFTGEDDGEMLANLLFERMVELGGIGLSANQVGINYRVFVLGKGENRLAVFNPKIIEQSAEVVTLDEGCLSFPGVYVKVNRSEAVTVEYQDPKGNVINTKFTGLTARVFLHEYDHMEGITFDKRVSKLKWDLAYNRMQKRNKKIIRKGVQEQLKAIAEQMASQA